MLSKKITARRPARRLQFAAATAAALTAPLAGAQDNGSHRAELPPVVVTANPLGSGLFDLVAPTSVLTQQEISARGASTLGETLNGVPGVSSSYFGPNASRPVIRGLDADRIKVMQNGVGLLDASALSPDHAVPMDPLAIEQIEVVRGPAALLYGGTAVGGVVNAIDNRIPQDPITQATGRAEVRHGGADKQNSASAVLEAGNGTLAVHADVFDRKSQDLVIPGFARSSQLRAQSPQADEANGRLRNSGANSDGGALGASLTFAKGYAGVSYSGYNSDYGTVAEADVRIRMKSDRWDFGSEIRDLGPVVSKVKLRLANTDYEHREIEAGQTATTFRNKGKEGLIEATHGKLGPLSGAVGLQFHTSDFSAVGAEALLPATRSESKALYVYEELPLDRLKLTFGGRLERATVDSAGGGPADPSAGGAPRFGTARQRSFTPQSMAGGALYPLSKTLTLAANVSSTERAPTYNELFANGPHKATGQYEVGSADLSVEKSKAVDLQLRWRDGAHSASIGAFYTRFSNYIALFRSGNTRGADGELNPTDADGDGVADGSGEEVMNEARLLAVPAIFKGLEAEGKFHVYEGAGDLDMRLKADYVRASDRDTGRPLPRIAPLRLGIGFDYRLGDFAARIDATYAAKQNRTAANESPTAAYTMVDVLLSYKLRTSLPNAEAFLKVSNLLNEEARLHTSVLKDIAPLGGRSAMIGLRGSF